MLRYKFIGVFAVFAVLFFFSGTARAGHIAGANLSYECVGTNEYLISLSIFRDCYESNLELTQIIKFKSDCGHFFSRTANQTFTEEVSQLCPTALANSTCNGGWWPGIEIYKYQVLVTLAPCDSWQIYWELCTRSESNNVDDTVFPCYQINAHLNNVEAPCNNSPVVTIESIPYVCVNQPVSFNPGITEADGDSLRFYLVPGLNSGGMPIPYEVGFSGLFPLPGITIGNNSGQLSFTPTNTGKYTVVIEVEEYNDAGVLIGTLRHDINFVVENCPQPVPQPDSGGFSNYTGSGNVVDGNVIEVCGGDQFCAEIEFSSVNPASIITLSTQLETTLPGAVFTTTGTNPVVGEICWTVPPGFSNSNQITITAQDNACPVFGVATWGFVITPSVGVYGGPDKVICEGQSVQLQASGDVNYVWQSFSGDPINEGVNFSCVNCPNPIATPSQTTTYLVTGLGNLTECINTDTVVVAIAFDDIEVNTVSESCFLDDAAVVVNIPYGSGNYSFLWSNGETTQNLIDVPAGDYGLVVTDLDLGCSLDTLISIAYPPFPPTNAGENDVSCGTTYVMQAEDNAAIGYWSFPPSADVTFFPDVYAHDAEVIVINNGTYTFYWIEDNGNECTGIDSVSITFTNPPPIEIDSASGTCGLDYMLTADLPAIGTAYWSAGPGITFAPDEFDPDATVTVPDYGTYYISWNLDLGNECGGTDSIEVIFEEPLIADAGIPVDSICGDTYDLLAVAGGDTSFWSTNDPELSFTTPETLPSATVTASTFGTFEAYWTIQTDYCTSTDTVQITFLEPPFSNAGPDSVICGLEYTLMAVPSAGDSVWIGTAGVLFNPDAQTPNAVVTVPTYGTYSFVWTEDNSFVCQDADTVEITFVELPVANAGMDTVICGSTYDLQAIASVGQGSWSGPPEVLFADALDPNTGITATQEGVYILTWTEDNGNGCTDQDDVQVTFYDIPQPDAGTDDTVCGLVYSLDGTVNTGTPSWAGPVGATFAPDELTEDLEVTAPDNGTHTFYLTEDNNGCAATDSVSITFVEIPIANAGADTSTCGLDIQLAAIPSLGTGNWSAGTGVTIDDPSNPNSTISVLTSGVYILTWTEDNGNGCTDQDDVQVTFYDIPQPDAGTDDTVCGLVYTLDGTVNSGSPSWAGPVGATFAPDELTEDPTVTAPDYGVHTFYLTEDNNGCAATDSVSITFVEIPIANAGADTSTCGLDIQLAAIPSLGTGSWSAGAGVTIDDPSNPNSTISVLTSGVYTLTWTEDNGNGCTDQDDVQVTFYDIPQPDAGTDDTVCGLVYTLDGTVSSGTPSWAGPAGSIFAPDELSEDPEVTAPDYGVHTFYLTEDNNGCAATDSVSITFVEIPIANAGADTSTCGLDIQLAAIPSLGNGSWSAGAGVTIDDPSNPNSTISVLTSGVYTLTWTEDNGNGCTDQDDVQVTFYETPQPEAGTDDTVCGLVYTLDGTVNSGSPSWAGPAGSIFAPDELTEDPEVTVLDYGSHTFYLTEDNNGCAATDSVSITFVEIPVANAGADTSTCGLDIQLAAIPSLGNGSWSAGAGVTIDDPSNPNSTISVLTSGVYTLTWTEDNGNGCTDQDDVQVTFYDIPQPDAGTDDAVCGLVYTLDGTVNTGTPSWTGPVGATFAPDELTEDPEVTVLDYGSHTFYLTEEIAGCSGQDSVTVIFIEVPVSNAGSDETVCGLVYELEAVPSVGLGSWTVPAGLVISDPTDPNAEITAPASGIYELYWVEQLGQCDDSAMVTIEFVAEPVADAGEDEVICGLEYTLEATNNVGTGTWLPIAGLTFDDSNDGATTVTADNYGTYTLTWEVSGGGTCVDSDEVQITFEEGPTADAGEDAEVCGLAYTLEGVDAGAGGIWSGPSEIVFGDVTDPTTTATSDSYGTFNLTWTVSSGSGCNAANTVTITFTETPVADAGEDDSVCGLEYELDATPSAGNGEWTTAQAGVVFAPNATSPNASITVSSAGSYTFVWTETNGSCADTDSVTVVFTEQPIAGAGADDSICGLTYALSATGNNGTWSGPTGVVFAPSATDPNASATVTEGGDYTLTWTIDNGNGCVDSDSVTLSFYETPAASNVTHTCIDGNVNYVVTFTISGGDEDTYTVTGDGTLTGNTFTSDPIANGATYNFEVQDANGCDVVVVSGSNVCPNLTYAGTMNLTPLEVCGDGPVSAIHNGNNTLDGNDALVFVLHSNPSLPLGTVYAQSATAEFSFQVGMVYGQTYYVSAVVGNDDGMGGVDFSDPLLSVSQGTPVVFYDVPTAVISGDGFACVGDTLWVSVQFTGTAPYQFTYSFNGQVQVPINTSEINVLIPVTETGQLMPIQVGNAQCEGTVSGLANLQFAPLPQGEISGGGAICEGETEQIEIELTGDSPFTFVYAVDNIPQAPIVTNLNIYTITVMNEGLYTLISVEDQTCVGETSGEAELEITPIPEAITGADVSVCYDAGGPQIGDDPVPGYSYSWSNGQFLSNAQSANPQVVYNDDIVVPVDLTFVLTVSDNGCTASNAVEVTLLPTPTIETNASVSMCEGGAAQLSVSGADDIDWQPNQYISDNSIANPFVYPPEDQTYSVGVSNSYGCSAEGEVFVEVHPMPEVVFDVSVDTACAPAVVTFYNQTDPQFSSSCLWNFGNGNVGYSCSPSLNVYYPAQGVYNVSLTVTTAHGCSATITQYEMINTVGPTADFDYIPELPSVSHSLVQFTNLSSDAVTYMWDFSDLGSSMQANPAVDFPNELPGEYEVCLTAIDSDGCYDEHCEIIEIAPDLLIYIPNAFSPNGDGINDLFFPVMEGVDIVEYQMQIFNRRGHMVWSATDPEAKWDGTDMTGKYLDDNQPYVWKLRIKDATSSLRVDRKGHVSIIR